MEEEEILEMSLGAAVVLKIRMWNLLRLCSEECSLLCSLFFVAAKLKRYRFVTIACGYNAL